MNFCGVALLDLHMLRKSLPLISTSCQSVLNLNAARYGYAATGFGAARRYFGKLYVMIVHMQLSAVCTTSFPLL